MLESVVFAAAGTLQVLIAAWVYFEGMHWARTHPAALALVVLAVGATLLLVVGPIATVVIEAIAITGYLLVRPTRSGQRPE